VVRRRQGLGTDEDSMMDCKEIGRLVSEGHDRRLSLYERFSVRMHLAMCYMCRNFSRQIAFIRRVARAAGEAGPRSLIDEEALFDRSLSPEAKSRMKQALSGEET
jgi:predicted anti-sigma-YlaC factor YlaD